MTHDLLWFYHSEIIRRPVTKPIPKSGFIQVGENLRRYIPLGTYYARVRIGGKLRTKSLKTKSATTAKLRLAQFIKEERTKYESKKQSGRTDDGILTVRGATDRFNEELTHEGLKPRSIEYYNEIIKAVEKTWPDLMAMDVRKVTVKQVKDWATRLRKDGTQFHIKGTKAPRKGISPTRFNASVRILRRIFEVAVKEANLYANPVRDIKLARVTDKLVTLPTKEQFKVLVTTIENARGRFSRACADMVRFLAFSGCRIDEARRVLFGDIDWEREEIAIKGDPITATKNWETSQDPPLPATARDAGTDDEGPLRLRPSIAHPDDQRMPRCHYTGLRQDRCRPDHPPRSPASLRHDRHRGRRRHPHRRPLAWPQRRRRAPHEALQPPPG